MRVLLALALTLSVVEGLPSFARASFTEEAHSAVTADGWRLALHRYRPAEPRFREPVLLTHGFIEDRRIWDLDPGHSLARSLAERGFDVWTMELRGSGESQAPPVGSLRGWRFSIDDFIRSDAPASIDAVLRETGAPQVLLVGHSLGGLVVYATLEGDEAGKVKAAVTLAGAGTMSAGPGLKLRFDRFFKFLGVTLGPRLPENAPFPVGWALHKALGNHPGAWAALGRAMATALGHPFWSERDMTPELVTRLLRDAVTNTSLNVVRQFLAFAEAGTVEGVTDRLGEIRAPVLAIAGSEDLVIPASDVRMVAGLSRASYIEVPGVGHEDLCVGLAAPAAVYPVVGDWLARHATPLGPSVAARARSGERIAAAFRTLASSPSPGRR